MKKVFELGIVTLGLVLCIIAKPHGFDDEGEISVPRSPKIQGPSEVSVTCTNGTLPHNLECDIEGSPTPTVIWFKDEQEIHSDSDSYNTTYDVTEGKAQLVFTQIALKNEKDVIGNFTCIAANFLGRAQKTFRIEMAGGGTNESNTTTSSSIPNTPENSTNSNDSGKTATTSSAGSETSETSNISDDSKTTPASRLQQILGK